MTVTWTTDKANAAITDSTTLGKITNMYQAAFRHTERGVLASLGPAGFCSLGDAEKGLEASKKVAEFIQGYSALALSSLHLVPVYRKELLDDPSQVPEDPGAENPNMAFYFKVYESGNPKAHKATVYIPRAKLAEAGTTQFIGEELQAMFNGRAQVSTVGQPDYVAPHTKLLPTGWTCRFIKAGPGKNNGNG